MKYRLVIQPRALQDIEEAYQSLEAISAPAAIDWFNSVDEAIQSLSELPGRFALAPEAKTLGIPIRQMPHGKKRHVFRILYTIRETEVHILRVRHSAREPFDDESYFQ